jgi:hypothetical protein
LVHQEGRKVCAVVRIVEDRKGAGVAGDPRKRLVMPVASYRQFAVYEQFVSHILERHQGDRIAEGVKGPPHVRIRSQHQAGFENAHVMTVPWPDHQAMGAECHRGVIGVPGAMPDLECGHGLTPCCTRQSFYGINIPLKTRETRRCRWIFHPR